MLCFFKQPTTGRNKSLTPNVFEIRKFLRKDKYELSVPRKQSR